MLSAASALSIRLLSLSEKENKINYLQVVLDKSMVIATCDHANLKY